VQWNVADPIVDVDSFSQVYVWERQYVGDVLDDDIFVVFFEEKNGEDTFPLSCDADMYTLFAHCNFAVYVEHTKVYDCLCDKVAFFAFD